MLWGWKCDIENRSTCALSHFPPQMFCWLAALEICDVRHYDTTTPRHLSHSILGGGGGGRWGVSFIITIGSSLSSHVPSPSSVAPSPSQMIVTSWAFTNNFSLNEYEQNIKSYWRIHSEHSILNTGFLAYLKYTNGLSISRKVSEEVFLLPHWCSWPDIGVFGVWYIYF